MLLPSHVVLVLVHRNGLVLTDWCPGAAADSDEMAIVRMLLSIRLLQDGILESYWGEHIHLGYYDEEERKKVREGFVANYSPTAWLPSTAR